MISRRYIVMALTVCGALSIVLLSQVHGTKSVSISENFAQERLSKKVGKDLPIKGPAQIAIKRASLQEINVHIADGQADISAKIEGDLRFGKSFSLVSSATGVPSYSEGAFYFHPDKIKVQELSLQGQKMLTGGWMTSLVEAAAIHAFEKRPVYRLKDDVKGHIIRATLTSIKAEGDHIELTFSLWQLTKTAEAGLILLILSLGGAVALVVRWRFAGASPVKRPSQFAEP